MNLVLLIIFVFTLTLAITSFQKAYSLKSYNFPIKGQVIAVSKNERGVFFDIEYVYKDQKEVYQHRFAKSSLPEYKMAILTNRFIGTPFYLIAKLENDQMLAVSAYSNAKLARWGYLLLTIIVGYFFIPF